MRSMLGFEFEDKTTPFAVMGFVQSITVFAFNLIEAQVMSGGEDQMVKVNWYISSTCSLGVISFLIMMTFKYKKAEEEPKNNGYKKIINDRDDKIQKHSEAETTRESLGQF